MLLLHLHEWVIFLFSPITWSKWLFLSSFCRTTTNIETVPLCISKSTCRHTWFIINMSKHFIIIFHQQSNRTDLLKCSEHLNESLTEQCSVFSCGAVYHPIEGSSNFWVCGWNPKVWLFKWKHLAVFSCGAVYFAIQGGSNFSSVRGWNSQVWPFKWKLLSNRAVLSKCATGFSMYKK